jgi:caffeoyl-CoA O-methyltransferase
VRTGPALDTVLSLPAGEPFDFVFIDADKPSYDAYYEEALRLLRPGGLVVIDNVLLSGRVLSPAEDDANARAIDALNRKIASDDRVDCAMIPVADGVTLAIKR